VYNDDWDPWRRYWKERERLQWDPWYRYEYEKEREQWDPFFRHLREQDRLQWDPWFRYWKEQERLTWDPEYRYNKEQERLTWDPWYRTLKEIEKKHMDPGYQWKEDRYSSSYERYETRRELTEEEKRSLELLRAISLYNQLYDRGPGFWLKLALQIGALGFLAYLLWSLATWRPPLP